MPKVSEVIEYLIKHDFLHSKGQVIGIWDDDIELTGVASHSLAQKGDIAWTLKKNLKFFDGSLLLLPEKPNQIIQNSIVCKNNKLAFIKVLQKFFEKRSNSKNVVYKGSFPQMGPLTTVTHTIFGNNVTLGRNCVIGDEGFGHAKDDTGIYQRFPHFGKIVIGDNVEVGSNVSIQRGTIDDTVIRDYVRIWHKVNIGHNVFIGDRSIILNGAIICGSVVIGTDTWIAPGAIVMNKLKIGHNCVIGLGSVVTKDVADNTMVAGNPARVIGKVDENTRIMRSHR